MNIGNTNSELKSFVKNLNILNAIPVVKTSAKNALTEYPFDAHLLSLSRLYRRSRRSYLDLGGTFQARVCSTMRSLSAQDLFLDQIDFSPIFSELLWFKDHSQEVADPQAFLSAISCYSGISLYHEQNHRILWRLLPPAPKEVMDFWRYLDFAESLVVTLDLALGDEIGRKLSPLLEDLKVIYRPGGEHKWWNESKGEYRQYLRGLLFSTYLSLQLIEPEDIPKAVDYVVDAPKKMNREAARRGQDLNEFFTLNTNQQWKSLFWKKAQQSLAQIQKSSQEDVFYISEDPLDFEEEFVIADRIFDYFGL